MICSNCGSNNRPGTIFCEECGRNLLSDMNSTLPTKQFEGDSNALGVEATWGTARFAATASVLLHFREHNQPIAIQPSKRILIGRADQNSQQRPDVDLTPYGALEKGVSRIHASLERDDETLNIIDMGSSNGTYLNGQRLTANQPRVLRDGDEVRFGKMIAHVYFK
jgi:hypothetical protein